MTTVKMEIAELDTPKMATLLYQQPPAQHSPVLEQEISQQLSGCAALCMDPAVTTCQQLTMPPYVQSWPRVSRSILSGPDECDRHVWGEEVAVETVWV